MFVTAESVKQSLGDYNLLNVKKLDITKVVSRFLKGDVTDQKRIESKNILLIHLIETQMLSNNFEIEVRNQCSACSGRGFDIIMFETELIDCPLVIKTNKSGKKIYSGCNGTGWKIDECSKCNGTGRIGEVPCPTCINRKTGISSGTYHFHPTRDRGEQKGFSGKKCLICKGTGKIKKIVQRESDIKEICTCAKCSGSGINKTIGTAVIDKKMGEILKNKCKTVPKNDESQQAA
jgi:DnaJ-class molecular chaperone